MSVCQQMDIMLGCNFDTKVCNFDTFEHCLIFETDDDKYKKR